MNSPVVGLRIASILFGVWCLVRLARLVTGAQVIVAGYQIPVWPAAIGFVVIGALSIWLWTLSNKTATR